MSVACTREQPFSGSFIGRDGDLAAVERLVVDGSRLVTLLGPGGVGKTTLARHLLLRLGERGERLFCDLTTARTAVEMTAAVGTVVGGCASQGGPDAQEARRRMGRALAHLGACTLVMDNLEQLEHEAIPWIGAWLGAAPELVVIATSRARLGVAGETVYRVAPLSLEGGSERPSDAVRLFDARARALRDALSAEERRTVERIVALLDGIPLALEMAASRLCVLSPEELLKRLSRPHAVLTAGARRSADRHGSLSRVLDESFDLLAALERSLLTECAVFAGGFTLEALEAISSVGASEVLPTLEALVDTCFVRPVAAARAAPTRYGVYEVVRQYALESSPQLVAEARRRHAEYFASWGEARLKDLEGAAAESALADLLHEDANLTAALDFARAGFGELEVRLLVVLEPARLHRGQLDTWITELERVLEDPRTANGEWMVRLQGALARARHDMGHLDACRALYETTASRARALGNRALEGRALCDLGRVLATLGHWTEACALFDRVRNMPDVPDFIRAHADACRAFFGFEIGVSNDEIVSITRYVEMCRRGADPRETAFWLVQLAAIEGELHPESDRPEVHLAEVLARAERSRDPRSEAYALFVFGMRALVRGRLAEGGRSLRRAASLYHGLGKRRLEAWAIGCLGIAHALAAEWDDASRALDEAIEGAREVGDAPREGSMRAFRGAVWARCGEPTRAADEFEHARALAPKEGDRTARMIDLCAMQLDVLLASASDDPPARERRLNSARVVLGANCPRAEGRENAVPFELRMAAMLLQKAISDVELAVSTLRIARDGSKVVLPGRRIVEVGGRKKLKAMLVALAQARIAQRAAPLSVSDLARSGWPNERVRTTSSRNRVHVALDTLRRLGLRGVLVRRDGGWMLDPSVPCTWIEVDGEASAPEI